MSGSGRRLRTVGAVGATAVAVAFLWLAGTFMQVRSMGADDPRGSTEVIVVMGAAQYDGRPSDMLERRLRTALRLWNEGRGAWLAVTGGKKQGDRFTEAGASAKWLEENGVPAGRILREETGASTWESLSALAPVLRGEDLHTALVVSTDWHVARAVLTMRELGFDAHPATAGPAQESLGRWLRETLAVAAGRVIGFGRLHSVTG